MQRKDMVRAAEDVARKTTFSSREAAAAFYYLASAGLNAKQSIAALPAVAQFAQAGMMDLEAATELLMDSQSALGLKVEDAAQNMENMVKVSDVLTEAANVSNGSIMQFGGALANVAPMMRQVNMNIEEGVAVLSVYADQGIKGEEAGTRFSIVLRDLQTRAMKNKEAFEQYNVAVYDSNGMMRNMSDIIADLERAMAGKTDEQKKAILAEMEFQDRSVTSMLSLVGMSDAIKDYEKKLRDAGGTTQEVAEKQLQTLNNQLKLTKNSIELAAKEAGEHLAPAIIDASKAIRNIADGYAKWSQEHPIIAKQLTTLLGILGSSSLAGGTLLFAFGALAKSIGNITQLFPSLAAPLTKLITVAGKATGAVALLATLAAGIVKAVNAFQGYQEAIESAGKITEEETTGFGNFLRGLTAAYDKLTIGLDRSALVAQKMAPILADLARQGDNWANTLKLINPSQENLAYQIQQGKANWDAYKARIWAVDTALVKNKDTIIDFMAKFTEKIGLVDKDTIAQRRAKEELDGLTISIKDHIAAGESDSKTTVDLAKQAVALADKFKLELDPAVRSLAGSMTKGQAEAERLKDELNLVFTSDLKKRIADIEKALKLYKGQLLPEQEKQLRAELTLLNTQLKIARGEWVPLGDAIRDTTKAWDACATELESGSLTWEQMIAQTGLTRVQFGRLAEQFYALASASKLNVGKVSADAAKMENAWAEALLKLTQDFSRAFTGMLSGTETFASGMKSIITSLATSFGQIIGTQVTDSLKSIGAMAGPLGSLVGGIIGGVLSIFGGLFEASETYAEQAAANFENAINQIINSLAYLGKVSGSTAELIMNQAEAFMNTWGAMAEKMGGQSMADALATTLYLNELMADTGVNAYNLSNYWALAGDALEQYSNMQITAAQASDVLDDAFSTLIAAAKEMGQEGSAEMVKFILEVREAGLEVASVTKYVQSELGKIPAALTALTNAAAGNIQNTGKLAVATFNAMIASGVSWTDAVKKMSEPLSALAAKYTELGLTADPALQALMDVVNVTEANEELFTAIDANKQVLDALANSGWLTADSLQAITDNAQSYFNDLIAAGVDSDTALRMMGPTLQQIQDQAATYGLALDDNTQSLIDQAKALGIIADTPVDPGTAMAEGFGAVTDALNEIVDLLKGAFPQAADQAAGALRGSLGKAVDDVNKKLRDGADMVAESWSDAAAVASNAWGDITVPEGSGLSGVAAYASGGVAWTPQLATIAENEPEVIIPMSDYQAGTGLAAYAGAGGAGGASGTVINLTINAQTLDDQTIARASEKIYSAIEFEQRRRGRGL
jgi:TP901 family phage tail tape measure protein